MLNLKALRKKVDPRYTVTASGGELHMTEFRIGLEFIANEIPMNSNNKRKTTIGYCTQKMYDKMQDLVSQCPNDYVYEKANESKTPIKKFMETIKYKIIKDLPNNEIIHVVKNNRGKIIGVGMIDAR